ncbi:filamentous hemagglutinin N-terminal domain-containing protein, partial [Nostoc flagelliforme FACHB-838]
MIIKSWFGRGWQWKIGGYVSLVGILSIGVSDRVNAQIVPDNTLGAEGSVVTPNVNIRGIQSDRIDGGATRGANLFHSFQEFNVGEGRGAYFANPTGIENILTRVTGSNPSNILGRLGVLGEANLFLINPNGIVFGPNASLDIQGSFLATTADRIKLGDSGYFSATQPQTSSLLSVSPGALF